MNSEIEILDSKRITYLKWYLVAFVICLALILTRHFFRQDDLNSQPIGMPVLLGAVATLLVQAIYVIKSALLERDIHQNPQLDAALNNEVVKSLTTESWMAAYIGSCLMTLFFAFTHTFYPICDTVTISLTTIIAGAGAHRIYFYFRYISL